MREKILRLIFLCIILILIYKITGIDAAYKTGEEVETGVNIESWKILVNNTNIATTNTEVFELESYVVASEYVADGKIAPGSIFELPIEIDATETKNTDIRYDIKVDLNIEQEELYHNIKVMGVTEQNQMCEIIKTGENTYTGIITSDNTRKHDVKIQLIWENDEINNANDSKIGTNTQSRQQIKVPVTIDVMQYGNEEIKEYTEENILWKMLLGLLIKS